MPQGNGVSSTIRSANDPSPSAEGGEEDFASAEARRWLSDRPRHPFGSLTYKLVSYQRRQVAAALSAAVTTTKPIGDQPHVAWAHKFAGTYKPISSYSSGEGVWGRGASLREAASPPESSPKTYPFSSLFTFFVEACIMRRLLFERRGELEPLTMMKHGEENINVGYPGGEPERRHFSWNRRS